MDPLDTHDPLVLRHSARRAKFWKDLARNNPPPFLGPLVSIKEAMQALDRSEFYVRARMEDGRLNVWKDPVSRRVWILKDDLDLLLGDNNALQAKRRSRPSRKAKPHPTPNDPSEDLDAIGGWEAPKPPESAALLQEWQRESDAKYQQAQRENEEWYAAELAKLEGRDPETAIRQLQRERGWLTPEPAPLPSPGRRGAGGGVRPVSWSNPHARPRKKPEPYRDPDTITSSPHHLITASPHHGITSSPHPSSLIPRRFPIGWITSRVACSMLQVTRVRLAQYVREGKLERRQRPDGKHRFLYDSIEVERLAEQRLEWQAPLKPNESYTHWGPRSRKMELNEFDSWIKSAEAARLLGITRQRLQEIIREGKLPCWQKDPGKQGSRIMVSHNMVVKLRDNQTRQKNRDASLRGRSAPQPQDEGWEEQGIDAYQNSDSTPNTRRDWGEFYTTRQTAHKLGISVGSVHCLRIRGRLTGHHHTWRKGESGRKWWFFKKEDVHNLQADPEYIRHHKRYKKQFDKIWQEDPAPEPENMPAPIADSEWSWSDADLPIW